MVPCALEESVQAHGPTSSRPLMAVAMYERLQRMSAEHGLNLSPEDILISAYLGHNLFYKPSGSVGGELETEQPGPEGVGKTSPMHAGGP